MLIADDEADTWIYALSLHDALPISLGADVRHLLRRRDGALEASAPCEDREPRGERARRAGEACVRERDRKSTRLNSSHANISYAVFCLKKKSVQHGGALCGRVTLPAWIC